MKENLPKHLEAVTRVGRTELVNRLSDALTGAMPESTRRLVGRVTFPGKATAVVGMRRAGKTRSSPT